MQGNSLPIAAQLHKCCNAVFSVCASLCCKTCAERPVFAPLVGELGAADPRICAKALHGKCYPGPKKHANGNVQANVRANNSGQFESTANKIMGF